LKHLSSLLRDIRLIAYAGTAMMLNSLSAAESLKSPNIVLQTPEEKPKITDEKGQIISKRHSYFTLFIGNRFSIPDLTAAANAKTFSENNILRTSETVYRSTGATLGEESSSPGLEPQLRVEWEVPFERISFLPAWEHFAAHMSVEGGFTSAQNALTSSGPFRYLNDQANAAELKDLTYTGSLTVSERRQNLTPMFGVGAEFSSAGMRRTGEMRFLMRVAAGVSLQNGQRSYELALNPQYVSAASNPAYSDTYVIKSSVTQSYAMAVLPAGRMELGLRMRLSPRMHFAFMGSMTMLYGILPYDTTGTFTEQAGPKTIYQKVITGASDEDSLRLIPAIFLALSLEL
jgi:hypothetical protein